MTAGTFSEFVFVDFENVGEVDLSWIEGNPVHATLLIGRHQNKIALPLVTQIHRLAGQVDLVEVDASGRNALDLTLAAYLGMAIERSPEAKFTIISKDKDFDAMIRHLSASGVTVSRHESLASASSPGRRRKAAPAADSDPRWQKLVSRLADPEMKNRPRSRKSLISHIRAQLGKAATEDSVDAVLKLLLDDGVLSFDSKDKIRYRTHPPRHS